MKDDVDGKTKLPVRRSESLPIPSDNPGTEGVISSAVSGFVSDMRRRAFSKRASETHAHADLLDARSRLATSFETLTRRTNRLRDLPNILEEDQFIRDEERKDGAHRRAVAALHRQQEIEREHAALGRARMERDLDYHKTLADKQADVEGAQARRIRSNFYRKLQATLVPVREKRLKHLYETGAIDAELDRIVAESERDDKSRKRQRGKESSATFSLDPFIEELNEEIANAQANHATDEELAMLYRFRARLKSRRAES